jgi:hypothetical protein
MSIQSGFAHYSGAMRSGVPTIQLQQDKSLAGARLEFVSIPLINLFDRSLLDYSFHLLAIETWTIVLV